MSIDHRLAVYGTLAPGRSNHNQLDGLGGQWRKATARGRLIARGWTATEDYPAFFPDAEAPPVDLLLFESVDLPRHWSRLDDFEGPAYRRVPIIVTIDGKHSDAWIYAAV